MLAPDLLLQVVMSTRESRFIYPCAVGAQICEIVRLFVLLWGGSEQKRDG